MSDILALIAKVQNINAVIMNEIPLFTALVPIKNPFKRENINITHNPIV